MEQLFQRTPGGRSQHKATDSKNQEILKVTATLLQNHEVISRLMEENVKAKKPMWRTIGVWFPHDTHDQIIEYMKYWSQRAEQPVGQLL